MRSFSEQVAELVEAGFSGIYCLTHEGESAEKQLVFLANQKEWTVVSWDRGRGGSYPQVDKPLGDGDTRNPIAPFQFGYEDTTLVLLHNFHRYLENGEVAQRLRNAVVEGKSRGVHYLIVSPVLNLPADLERLFTIIDHPLPGEEDFRMLVEGIETDGGKPAVEEGVFSAAKGLTRLEAENAFALSLVRENQILASVVREQKAQVIRKKGFLELYEGKEGFSSLGGLTALKGFCSKLLRPNNPVTPRGVMLLGPAGVGKSAFSKALGNETGRPTLLMDMGRMYDKYMGNSEANLRQALQLADALSPALLFVDEVEKGLAGVGGEGDSGVASRLFGHLLTWMNDHRSGVFVCLTSNGIEKLPPEFTRAGRIDATFFIDLPSDEDRDRIWKLYLSKYEIEGDENALPRDDQWTGAEIEACCRLSRGLGVNIKDAAQYIVPVAVSSGEKVSQLREWANSKCLDANLGGLFRSSRTGPKTGRRVKT